MNKHLANLAFDPKFVADVESRLGLLPNYLKLAPKETGISTGMWEMAKGCYLDNPLPSIFKERLSVSLSRFCENRYCIARHIGFLVGLGVPAGDPKCPPETVAQVEDLLNNPLAEGEALEEKIAVLESMAEPFTTLPSARTIEEEALLVCATHLFLRTQHATRCHAALRRAFDASSFEHLLVFLSFVRMTHFWATVHPDLKLEEDLTKLFSEHESLAERVFDDQEHRVYRSPELVSEELESLRWGRKQARLMETTLASIGDAVIAFDAAERVTLMNIKAEEMTGVSSEAATGRPLEDVFQAVDESTGGKLATHRVDEWIRVKLSSKDGSRRLVEMCVSPTKHDDSGSVLVFRDISECWKQEQALEERASLAVLGRDISLVLTSEDDVTAMLKRCADTIQERLDAASVVIWNVLGGGDKLERVASAGLDAAGLTVSLSAIQGSVDANAAAGHNPVYLNSDQLEGSEELMRQAGLEGFAGFLLVMESRILGALAIYSKRPISSATEDTIESVASGLAMSVERKQTLTRLRESELRYRLVGQAANDAIWDWDLVADQVTWNDGVLKCFGYESVEVALDSSWWLKRIHTDDRARVSEGIHKAIGSGDEQWREEYRFLRADGNYAFVLDRGRIVRDAEKRPLRMVGSMLDVTERKQRERGQDFLVELASRLQVLEDPDEVAEISVVSLAKHLGVDRCVYLSVEGFDRLNSRGDFSSDESVESIHWSFADLGEKCEQSMRLNEVYFDFGIDSRAGIVGEQLAAYRALICVPVRLHNALVAVLVVAESDARRWTSEERGLVGVVAERCAEAMNKAHTQLRLRESEERVRMSVQAAEIGTWDYELTTGFLIFSERCKEVFGLSREDPISYDIFLSLLHPEDRTRVDEQVQKAFDPNGDGYYNIDYRVVWPDGSIHWIVAKAQAIFRKSGEGSKAVRFVGAVLDITDRKEAEEQLRESERFTRTVLESTPDCIKILDADGRLQMINKQGLLMMEIDDFEVVKNREWWSLWPEVRRGRLKQAVACAKKGQSDRFQADCPTSKGKTRWWDVVVAPVVDEDGKLLRIISVTRDISTQKEAEERLRDAAARLSEADRRKDEFLAMLAHELRNPLAPIRSGVEVLKVAREDAEVHEEVRGMMEQQTLQLINLVDDLLEVSRITLGKLELRRSRVEIQAVIKSAVEACKPLMKEAGHAFSVTLPDRPIEINADPNRLAQVVSNLLNNAARYTPEGGHVELCVELKDDAVEIIVRDDGIGIPADKRSHIFEIFGQVNRNSERTNLGLGIGLTLVRSLVDMHGGRVDVESDGEDCGSVFIVTLPLERQSEPHIEDDTISDSVTPAKAGQRVLVVDDNVSAAKILTMVVKLLGKEVRTAHDGVEAIDVAKEFKPDVILMDLGMPKMSGDEAARHIRKQAWGEHVFLVALTGWGQDKDREKTAEAGFDRHLVKPSEPDELKRILEEAAALREES